MSSRRVAMGVRRESCFWRVVLFSVIILSVAIQSIRSEWRSMSDDLAAMEARRSRILEKLLSLRDLRRRFY